MSVMVEEMKSLKKNTWEFVQHLKGKRVIGRKSVFKIKPPIIEKRRGKVHGSSCRKWILKKKGINYDEIFSLIGRHTFIGEVLALIAS